MEGRDVKKARLTEPVVNHSTGKQLGDNGDHVYGSTDEEINCLGKRNRVVLRPNPLAISTPTATPTGATLSPPHSFHDIAAFPPPTHATQQLLVQHPVQGDVPPAQEDGSLGGQLGDATAQLETPVIKLKKRCANWPVCAFGSKCKFIHPSTNCGLWPACPYGATCFYIHPEVSCKYGLACRNPYCSYFHGKPSTQAPTYFGTLSEDGSFRNKSLVLTAPIVQSSSAPSFSSSSSSSVSQQVESLSLTLPGTPPHLKRKKVGLPAPLSVGEAALPLRSSEVDNGGDERRRREEEMRMDVEASLAAGIEENS